MRKIGKIYFTSVTLSPQNGFVPATISHKTKPKLYVSDAVVTLAPFKTSGAIKAGVPVNPNDIDSVWKQSIFLAKPRSPSLARR